MGGLNSSPFIFALSLKWPPLWLPQGGRNGVLIGTLLAQGALTLFMATTASRRSKSITSTTSTKPEGRRYKTLSSDRCTYIHFTGPNLISSGIWNSFFISGCCVAKWSQVIGRESRWHHLNEKEAFINVIMLMLNNALMNLHTIKRVLCIYSINIITRFNFTLTFWSA